MKKMLRAILRHVPYGVLCRLLYEIDLRLYQIWLLKRLPLIRKVTVRSIWIRLKTLSIRWNLLCNLDKVLRRVLFTSPTKRLRSDVIDKYFPNNYLVFKSNSKFVFNHE